MPVGHAGVILKPFTPLSLGPTLWLDASDTSTITASSGAVSQWNDKSGNGHNVTQSTSSQQPITGTTTLNSLNVIKFDGTNDILTSSSLSLGYSISLFAVFKTASGGTQMIVCHGTSNSSSSGTFYLYNAGPTFRHVETAGGQARNTFTSAIDGSWKYLTAIAVPATTTVVRSAKTSIWTSENTPTVTSWSNSAAITVGGRSDGLYLNGTVAEIILCEYAVSNSARDSVEGYLSSKWGL